MTPPLLLIGVGLLFWGWQANLFAFAIPMAIILEVSRYVPWRWEFSDKDLNRLSDVTNLLFAGVAVYLFYQHGPHGVYATIRWVPALLFVLLALSARVADSRDFAVELFIKRIRASGDMTGPSIAAPQDVRSAIDGTSG